MADEIDRAMAALEAAEKAVETAHGVAIEQPWSADLVRELTFGVLGFSCFVLILATVLLWRSNATPLQILRVFAVITIIGFSAVLLVVGYNNEQLTPIIGLFGAIAGYLLGKDSRPSHTS